MWSHAYIEKENHLGRVHIFVIIMLVALPCFFGISCITLYILYIDICTGIAIVRNENCLFLVWNTEHWFTVPSYDDVMCQLQRALIDSSPI